MIAYHGTHEQFDRLEPGPDGGIHLGTLAQARMRAGPNGRVIEVEFSAKRPRRSRDAGSGWKSKIAVARRGRHDAIVYLNRYEGISVDGIIAAEQIGVTDVDSLTDTKFRKLFPEACDSWIAFSTDQIKIKNTEVQP